MEVLGLNAHLENQLYRYRDLSGQLVFGETAKQAVVIEIMDDIFNEDVMSELMITELKKGLHREHATNFIEWSESETGIAALNAMNRYHTEFQQEDSEESLENYIDEISRDADRMENKMNFAGGLIRKFDLIRMNTLIMEDFIITFMWGVNHLLPEDEKVDDQQMNDLGMTFRNQFQNIYTEMLPPLIMYSFRHLDEEKLESFTEFLNSPTGRWYIRTYRRVIIDSGGEATRAFARSLAGYDLDQLTEE